jgi:hypothetical protein
VMGKMSKIVESVNERTRKVEHVQKLADLQDMIEGCDVICY